MEETDPCKPLRAHTQIYKLTNNLVNDNCFEDKQKISGQTVTEGEDGYYKQKL